MVNLRLCETVRPQLQNWGSETQNHPKTRPIKNTSEILRLSQNFRDPHFLRNHSIPVIFIHTLNNLYRENRGSVNRLCPPWKESKGGILSTTSLWEVTPLQQGTSFRIAAFESSYGGHTKFAFGWAVDIVAGWWMLFTTLEMRRKVELKCVPYMVLGLLLGMH